MHMLTRAFTYDTLTLTHDDLRALCRGETLNPGGRDSALEIVVEGGPLPERVPPKERCPSSSIMSTRL